MTKIKMRKFVYLLFTLVLLSTAGCESEHKRPENIYIPEGYVGWVRIEYGVEGAPELDTDFLGPWEHQRFPPSGLLQTSSELHHGAATAKYFYYSENGEKPLPYEMVNGGIISWCAEKPDGTDLDRHFVTFFVGPKEEYDKHQHELLQFKKGDCKYVMNSLDDLPKVGNVRARQ